MFRTLAALALVFALALPADAQVMRRAPQFGGSPPAPPCATQEFVVEFGAGSTSLDAIEQVRLVGNVANARPCNVLRVFVASYEPLQANVVRDLLRHEGVPVDRLETVTLDVPISPPPYTVDRVRVTLLFR